MIYSVWNQGKKLYDYYETNVEQNRVNAPKPSIPTGKFGSTIEQSSWKLPIGSKMVGSGDHAKGRIAVSGVSFGGFDLTPMKIISIAGAIIFLYLVFKKKW
ncbi:MAG: hypothetical protein Q8S00_32675 [Deltaproteobacteria bacterium]|nr:hypothetical protein [Deltaproteobacteria bacterium]